MNTEKLLTQEQIAALTEAVNKFADFIKNVFNEILNKVKPVFDWLNEICARYLIKAPARIKYLAFHHKKARVRKKNLARLYSYP